MKLFTAALAAGALALSAASAAQAAFPTYYSDQGSFTAAGTIAHTLDFDSFGSGSSLGLEYTSGPIKLTGTDFLAVIGPTFAPFNPVRNVAITDSGDQQLHLAVSTGGFNMLSFQLGNLRGYGEQVFLELNTNVDTYYYGLYPGPAAENLTFSGFVVPTGEYFTGLSLNATDVDGSFQPTPIDQIIGLTDVRLGYTKAPCATRVCGGAVPEPATWALTILGFGLTGAALRRRRSIPA